MNIKYFTENSVNILHSFFVAEDKCDGRSRGLYNKIRGEKTFLFQFFVMSPIPSMSHTVNYSIDLEPVFDF